MPDQRFRDQLGNYITLTGIPQRIVSLVPSQTELLYDLGLDDIVKGITRFCVHPTHWKNSKRICGGTKKFDFAAIDSIQPDLVIANKEENYIEGIDLLKHKYKVWVSDIYNLDDAFEMIRSVGMLTQRETESQEIVQAIQNAFNSLIRRPLKRVLYLIWRKPWMGAGRNTFIGSMLDTLGFENCLPKGSRYPELSHEEIVSLDPQVVLLSSEPYPFNEKHIEEIKTFVPRSKIVLVDGEMFSWYGSRLIKAPAYFNSLQFQ